MGVGCLNGRVLRCWKAEEQEAACNLEWAFLGLSAPGAPRALSTQALGSEWGTCRNKKPRSCVHNQSSLLYQQLPTWNTCRYGTSRCRTCVPPQPAAAGLRSEGVALLPAVRRPSGGRRGAEARRLKGALCWQRSAPSAVPSCRSGMAAVLSGPGRSRAQWALRLSGLPF